MNKRLILIGGGVVAVVAAILIVGDGAMEVQLSEVVRDTLSVSIPAEGRTRARDRFTVAAPVSGRLTRVDLRPGDLVEEGQLLGRIYPAPQDPRVVATIRAEVSAAEGRHSAATAQLREAEAQAAQADREVARRQPLFEMGAITREQMEQAELTARIAEERRQSAEASLVSARAALEGARARLLGAEATDGDAAPLRIESPVTGRVLAVPEESERVVVAGSPIVSLADTEGLEVVLDVLSEDAIRIAPGNSVILGAWGGEESLRGEVRLVTLVGYTKISALGVEEQRVDVIADLVNPPPTLGTGYRVSGEIVVWSGPDVISVPTSALFRNAESWDVFVADGGQVVQRSVSVGRRNEFRAEITAGLDTGELVVLFPPEELEDGSRIRAVRD